MAIKELKTAGVLAVSGELRQSNYLVEQDHHFLKGLVKPGMGFFSFETAWRTLQGDQAWSRSAKGRKKDVELEPALERLVEPETAGDPMSEQKWVRSSLRQLSKRLTDLEHRVSPPTVGKLLRKLGYSLRVNDKKQEASKQMHQLNIELAGVCSRWNYTLRPRTQIPPERDLEPEVIF